MKSAVAIRIFCFLSTVILLFSVPGAAFSLTKDEAMTVLLDAVTRDQQCQAAENLFRNYPNQLTPTDRDYVRIHVESLRCEFLQNPPQSASIAEQSVSCTPVKMPVAGSSFGFGPLQSKLIDSEPSGLLLRSQDGSQYKTTMNPDSFIVDFVKTPGDVVGSLPWKSLHQSDPNRAGCRSFSATVQLLRGNGREGAGLVYGYQNESEYYLYILDVGGQLTLYRVYGNTYPYELAASMEIIAQDRTMKQGVFSVVLARSPRLADFPNTTGAFNSQFGLTSPRHVRPYNLSIFERANSIELYVDGELFHTHNVIAGSGSSFGIAAVGLGKYRFINYAGE